MIRICFAVKSADSGIQNSADGSREMLANTPSNNSLADAGKTQTHLCVDITAYLHLKPLKIILHKHHRDENDTREMAS